MADTNPLGDIVQMPIPDRIDELADTICDDPVANMLAARHLHGVAELLRRGNTHTMRRDPAVALANIAKGITDTEAEASAQFDLTIDDVRAAGAEDLLAAAGDWSTWAEALSGAVQIQVARIRAGHTVMSSSMVNDETVESARRFATYLRTGK